MSVEGVGAAGWQRIDRTLLSIQYLRALAAIAVLVAHGLPGLPQLPISLLGLASGLATFLLVERPMMRLVRTLRAACRTRPLGGLAT